MIFTEKLVESLVTEHYGLTVAARALTGEYEFNFLLTASDGTKYIFKAAGDEHSYAFFDAQVKMVQHLQQSEIADKFYKFISAKRGELMITLVLDEKRYYLRLLSFLDGEFWIHAKDRPDALHYNLGDFLGKMDKVL